MMNPDQKKLLHLHRVLDDTCRKSNKPFVSGWYTKHPFYEHLLLDDDLTPLLKGSRDYKFLSDDSELNSKIRYFHEIHDAHIYTDESVFVGAGSSPLMLAALIALKTLEFKEVIYSPPIYYTLYYFCNLLGLGLTNIGESPIGKNGECECLSLSNEKSALIITDPSWISGKRLSENTIEKIANWQRDTSSFVFVDGTFQYLSWKRMECERTSRLIDEQCIRLVCPTKSLCVHGARFSYLLVPKNIREVIRYPYSNTTGAASVSDRVMAHRLMDQLLSDENNRRLAEYIEARYRALKAEGIIKSTVDTPDSTYYVFGETSYNLDEITTMNGDFFEIKYPENHIRVNLLCPVIDI